MISYEYKLVSLKFPDESDENMWNAVLKLIEDKSNEYGAEGWRLYSWYMQPSLHIIFERKKEKC